DFSQAKFVNVNFDRLQRNWLFLAGQFVRGTPMNFFRGKRWGHLLDAPEKPRSKRFDRGAVKVRREIRTLGRSVGIVGVGCVAEANGAVVALAAAYIKLCEARGASEKQDKN